MIDALCRGKLPRDLERMEDLLTSAVFGRLRYLPPSDGLLRFLAESDFSGYQDPQLHKKSIVRVEYHFWPWWKFDDCVGAEPDVVIDLWGANGTHFKLLVEAKLRSSKSSYPNPAVAQPTDQLAREWDNLTRACVLDGAQPVMLYLTADYSTPRTEIIESETEFAMKRSESLARYPFCCGWLSWRHLVSVFVNESNPIARDLSALMDRLDLRFFRGITDITTANFKWEFNEQIREFVFAGVPPILWTWRFGNG